MSVATLEAVLFEAEQYLDKGDLDRASVLFRCAHDLCAGTSELPAVGLARVALLMGQVQEARTILTDVRRRKPTSAAAALIWATVMELSKPIAEALPAFEEAVALAPDVWLSHYNLGRAYGQLERFTDAVRCFESARQLAPREAPILTRLATALLKLGRHEEAIVALVEAVARAPQQLDPTLCLVDALAEAGKEAEAIMVLAQAEARFPKSPQVHSKRASLALRVGDADAARVAVRKQLALDDRDAEAWLFRGALALGQLDVKEAAMCAERARELMPKSSRPWMLLGQTKEVIKARESALEAYLEGARLDDKAWQPRMNAAVLLLELGQPGGVERATELLLQAAAHVPEHEAPNLRYNLALAAARSGQNEQARLYAAQASKGGHLDAQRLLAAL